MVWPGTATAAAAFLPQANVERAVVAALPTWHGKKAQIVDYLDWIEVYARGKSGQYARILRYRGRTGYGDHNPLDVADSEMPEILEHFGIWKPGDALPIRPSRPASCGRLVFRDGEEWCK